MKDTVASIEQLIDNFRQSFDSRDWKTMSTCLDEMIEVDYSSFRGTKPGIISNEAYVNLRKKGLRDLITLHKYSHPQIEINGDSAYLSCDFEIHRTTKHGGKFLNSFGQYRFGLVNRDGNWKINHITQTVTKNEGDQSIHGAFSN